MQFESSKFCPSVQSAVLRDDGRIDFRIDGSSHHAFDHPPNVKQISLSHQGLSCLNYDNRIFHLSGEPQKCLWTEDEEAPNATAIGCFDDGQLAATSPSGELWLLSEEGWHKQDTVFPVPKPSLPWRRFWPSRKALVLSLVIVAAWFGWRKYSDVHQQGQAVRILRAQQFKIVYDYELKPDGTPVVNAKPPGPDWLRKLIGDEWFMSPVKLGPSNRPVHFKEPVFLALTTLKEVDVGYVSSVDLGTLINNHKLEKLTVRSNDHKTIQALGKLKSLRHLSITDRCEQAKSETFVDELEKAISELDQLESLCIELEGSAPDLSCLIKMRQLRKLEVICWKPADLWPIVGLQNLQTLEARLADLQPVSQLLNLESLTIWLSKDAPRQDLAILGNLKELRNLVVSAGNGQTDGQWLGKLRNLEELRLGKLHIANQKPLKSLKNLSVIIVGGALDVQLLTHTKLELARYRANKGFRRIERCDLSNCNVANLQFLSAMPVSELASYKNWNLSNNPLSDLTPLSQLLNSFTLDLSNTSVQNIAPLSKLHITEIDLSNTEVNNLAPLSTMPDLAIVNLSGLPIRQFKHSGNTLSRVNLSGTQVSDLANIQFKGHEDYSLDLSNTPVTDLTLIRTWAGSLNSLNLSNTAISDLGPLEDSAITHLNLSGTQISDLSPLKRSRITHLDLSGTRISDLTPLSKLLFLEELNLSDTQVTDLSPLKDLAELTSLNLSGLSIKSAELEHLRRNKKLRHLSLAGLPIDDLSVLDAWRLNSLNLSNTKIKDLKPVRGSNFLLRLSGAKIDMDDLATVTLNKEQCFDLLDLSGIPLKRLDEQWFGSISSIKHLILDCSQLESLDVLGNLYPLTQVELENVTDELSFDWLSKTQTRRLVLKGQPFDLTNLHQGLQQTNDLGEISFPDGTEIDFDKFPLFKTVRIPR